MNETLDKRSRRLLNWSWAAVLAPAVCVGVAAWTHRWVTDDAFIDFRVVGNILAGHGPVYNVGERVEVYTDPLWVAILTVFRGLLPILSIEWWSVILGLVCTVSGFLMGGRAAQRLGSSMGARFVFPMGLLAASVVAGVWDFSTSGLETSLVFFWLGLSWWLMVRLVEDRRRPVLAAFVIGLGPLIRPDLGLFSIVFLVVVAYMIHTARSGLTEGVWRRWLWPLLAAGAVPVGYQLFRMAYFALVVPNTALAKSSASSNWAQGFDYLKDFESHYWLWVPLVCLLPLTIDRIRRWWRAGQCDRALVLAAPVVGGILSVTYVVRIGGDFMHARFLLPGFFAIVLTLWIEPGARFDWQFPAAGIVAVWAAVCLAAFRPSPVGINPHTGVVFGVVHDIANERGVWQFNTGRQNPITLNDYVPLGQNTRRLGPLWQEPRAIAIELKRIARKGDPDDSGAMQFMAIGPQRTIFVVTPAVLPERVVSYLTSVGSLALEAGPKVYVFDQYSLANPVGSHITLVHRGRPGHEKFISASWMIARFSPPGTPIPRSAGIPAADIVDARAALRCQPLHSYLASITSPLTFGRAMNDIFHSWTDTTMNFPEDPKAARLSLCGGRAK